MFTSSLEAYWREGAYSRSANSRICDFSIDGLDPCLHHFKLSLLVVAFG